MTTQTASIVRTAPTTFRNSSKYPIRFDRLHPGSYFRIVGEPSRNMPRVRDGRIYRKDRYGFFATNVSNNEGCCLYPEDLVMPVIREKAS
jgi:hypothetical protein